MDVKIKRSCIDQLALKTMFFACFEELVVLEEGKEYLKNNTLLFRITSIVVKNFYMCNLHYMCMYMYITMYCTLYMNNHVYRNTFQI